MSSLLKPIDVVAKYLNSLNDEYRQIPFDDLKAMTTLERFKLYNWTFELLCLGIMVTILVVSQIGTRMNLSMADKLFDSLLTYLKDTLMFARVGLHGPVATKKHYLDNYLHTWLTSFATGRSTIESVYIKLHLLRRNNVFSLIADNIVGSLFPSLSPGTLDEYVEIVITPNGIYVADESSKWAGNDDGERHHSLKLVNDTLNSLRFIAAIVNKSNMNKARHDNYFLSITHTMESSSLPYEYVYMCELNQLSDFFSQYCGNKQQFTKFLNDAADFLQFMAFTDLPSEKPTNHKQFSESRLPRCIIRAGVPKGKTQLEALNGLVGVAVEIYDNFTRAAMSQQQQAKTVLTTETVKKINALRDTELQKLVRAAAEAKLEKQREAEKEALKEKRREMKRSGEQEKLDLKMKEKRERRQRNKMKVRAA